MGNGARQTHSQNGGLIGNRTWPVSQMAPLPVTFSDNECHFCCLKPFKLPYLCNCSIFTFIHLMTVWFLYTAVQQSTRYQLPRCVAWSLCDS